MAEIELEGSLAVFNRCVRLRQVCAMTGMSAATIYRKMAAGQFPKSFKLGPNMSAWRVATIEQWISEREKCGAQSSI